jgi:YD repeat-containing protein
MRESTFRAALILLSGLLCASTAIPDQMQYTYDSIGRLVEARAASGPLVSYGYDQAGNRTLRQQGGFVSGVDNGHGEPIVDLNGDGSVNLGDLAMLRGAYGAELGAECFVGSADYNANGRIDFGDLLSWYRCYPAGFLRPGDWTAGAASPTVTWDAIAPDDRVDYFDLVALAGEWGPVRDSRPAARWLDVAPEAPDGLVDARDLAVLRANWLTGGDAVPAVASTDNCARTTTEAPSAPSDAALKIRSRDGDSSSARPVVLDIVFNGAASEIASFQLLLGGDIDLDLNSVQDAMVAVEPPVWLGGGNTPNQAAHFLDVRVTDRGVLITGAYLDLSPTTTPASKVLCSIAVPRIDEERAYTVSQAIYSVKSGAVFQLSEWSGAVSLSPVPPVPVLLQNWPNPFNPVTTLKYAVPTATRVQLRVYDLQGRLVNKLVDQVLERGWHESQWDGRTGEGHAVASGLYFYKLQVGEETITRKMSLVR